MDEKQWHYMHDEQSVGPFSQQQLIALIESGTLNKNTLVWSESEDEWRAAHKVFDLGELTPPPLPGKKLINFSALKDNLLTTEWRTEPVHPWRRYFARILDIMICGSLFFMAFGIVTYAMSAGFAEGFFGAMEGPAGQLLDIILTTFVATFLSAAFIGYTRTSIGKWFFGIKVSDAAGKPIGYKKAFERELKVWFKGLGMGIPIVVLFTSFAAYQRLTSTGSTSWDEEMGLDILYKNNNLVQIIMSTIGLILILTISAILKSL